MGGERNFTSGGKRGASAASRKKEGVLRCGKQIDERGSSGGKISVPANSRGETSNCKKGVAQG